MIFLSIRIGNSMIKEDSLGAWGVLYVLDIYVVFPGIITIKIRY